MHPSKKMHATRQWRKKGTGKNNPPSDPLKNEGDKKEDASVHVIQLVIPSDGMCLRIGEENITSRPAFWKG